MPFVTKATTCFQANLRLIPMENHNLILKISRLFSSSCQFRTLPDVADSSISISKTSDSIVSHEEIDHSSFLKRPKNPGKHCRRTLVLGGSSDAEGRKCPPVTPISMADSLKKAKKFQEWNKTNVYNQQSSSSNSGWFSSGDEKFPETDALFSLSSCSGDSIRRKTRRRARCEEMKSIDELGERSFRSSLSSYNTAINGVSHRVPLPSPPKTAKTHRRSARKTTVKKAQHHPETELGFDHMSTHLYYYNQDYIFPGRRKTTKPRRKTAESSKNPAPMMEESLAVEKKSRDPRGDFRASMVDMILEKQLFGAEDLEKLLICFLNLNAVRYHGIILEVFSEICEALFSY